MAARFADIKETGEVTEEALLEVAKVTVAEVELRHHHAVVGGLPADQTRHTLQVNADIVKAHRDARHAHLAALLGHGGFGLQAGHQALASGGCGGRRIDGGAIAGGKHVRPVAQFNFRGREHRVGAPGIRSHELRRHIEEETLATGQTAHIEAALEPDSAKAQG